MSNKSKTIEFFSVTTVFFILTIIYLWRELPYEPGALRNYHDQLLHVWILGWDSWAVFHKPLEIFNTNILFPAVNTLALSDHLLGLFPNWFIANLFCKDFVAAHNYAYAMTYIFSCVAAYYYFRFWNVKIPASFIASIFYSFFLRSYLIEQIQLSSFYYAFPVFLFIEKYLAGGGKKNLVYLSISYMLGFLTGFYFAYMLSISVAIYLLIAFIMNRKKVPLMKFGAILLTFFVSLLILLPTIFPYIELRKTASLLEGAKTDNLVFQAASLSSNPKSWLYFFTEPYFYRIWGIAGAIYLLSRHGKTNRRAVITFAVIAVLFHILSLGPYLKINDRPTWIPLPYHLFKIIPGFTTVRYLYRFRLMAYIGEAFLIAATLNAVLSKIETVKFKNENVWRTVIFMIIGLPMLLCLNPRNEKFFFSYIPTIDNIPPIYALLASIREPGPVVEFPIMPSLKRGRYIYQYFSLFYHRKLFNGASGYEPFGNVVMWNMEMPLSHWVSYFRALGVKFIVSHPTDFIAQVIERSWPNNMAPPKPLPPQSSDHKLTKVWMDPIEKQIFLNGLEVDEFSGSLQRLGFYRFEFIEIAAAGRDKIIIDIGHDAGHKLDPAKLQNLPDYALKRNDILYISYPGFEKMIYDFGIEAHAILLHHAIDRIEVGGFRDYLKQVISNPFLDLSEKDAAELGLTKSAENGGSVIWRIEPNTGVIIRDNPVVIMRFEKTETGELKMILDVSVDKAEVWKNPNVFGCVTGTMSFRKIGETEYAAYPVRFGMTLALPGGVNYISEYIAKSSLAPGFYDVIANIPDLGLNETKLKEEIK